MSFYAMYGDNFSRLVFSSFLQEARPIALCYFILKRIKFDVQIVSQTD